MKNHLEAEVIEGRLPQNGTETAWRLAEKYAREHDLFEEE
jgi:hypothetical protein